jgi:tRNA modification GTPase
METGPHQSRHLTLMTDRFDTASVGEEILITHARHRAHMETAALHLEAFLVTGTSSHVSWQRPPDNVPHILRSYVDRGDVGVGAEELRYAAREIGKIGGHIGVEDILDVVFSRFCIGK